MHARARARALAHICVTGSVKAGLRRRLMLVLLAQLPKRRGITRGPCVRHAVHQQQRRW